MPTLKPSLRKLALMAAALAMTAPVLLVAPTAQAARFAVIRVFEPRAIRLQPPVEKLEPRRPAAGIPAGALIGGDPRPSGERYRPIAGAIIGGAIAGGYTRPPRRPALPQPPRRSWFELHTPQ